MFARMTTVQVRPDAIDQAVSIYRDSVIPAAKAQKGFVSAAMYMDRAAGKGVSITIWQTMDDLQAGETSGFYQEQVAKFAPLLTAAPVRESFEVSVSE
jgi:heme-degrading monooxygenase HmoA